MKLSIKKIIDEWDPIGLLPYTPADEYEKEVELIESYLCNTNPITRDSLGNEILHLFSRRFGSVFEENIATCIEIAKKILEEHK